MQEGMARVLPTKPHLSLLMIRQELNHLSVSSKKKRSSYSRQKGHGRKSCGDSYPRLYPNIHTLAFLIPLFYMVTSQPRGRENNPKGEIGLKAENGMKVIRLGRESHTDKRGSGTWEPQKREAGPGPSTAVRDCHAGRCPLLSSSCSDRCQDPTDADHMYKMIWPGLERETMFEGPALTWRQSQFNSWLHLWFPKYHQE